MEEFVPLGSIFLPFTADSYKVKKGFDVKVSKQQVTKVVFFLKNTEDSRYLDPACLE